MNVLPEWTSDLYCPWLELPFGTAGLLLIITGAGQGHVPVLLMTMTKEAKKISDQQTGSFECLASWVH